MEHSHIYNKAADLVEKGWIQGEMAKDKNGNSCSSHSENATHWCLAGALNLACFGSISSSSYDSLVFFLSLDDPMTTWNDDLNRTQEDVVELLRDAAKRADEQHLRSGSLQLWGLNI